MPERRTAHHESSHRPRARAVRATSLGLLLGLTLGLLTGCANLQPEEGEPSPTAVALDTTADEDAQVKLHAAVQASQPGSAHLADARRMLESLLADDGAEARAWHPFARALLEQIRERQRLAAHNERLARDNEALGRSAAEHEHAIAEVRRQHDALQRKLDALTEIEHRLEAPATAQPTDEVDRR